MVNLPSPFALVIYGAARGVLPFPLLAGAALLTLARIMRLTQRQRHNPADSR